MGNNPNKVLSRRGRDVLPITPARSWLTGNRVPYTGEQLREIRKRKGVGRPPAAKVARRGLGHAVIYPALIASHWGQPSPNLAEWERKPRRGEDAADYRARRISGMMDGIAKALAEMGYERATP